MSKNILLVAALGAAVFLVLQKQAQAKGATTPAAPAKGSTTPAQVNVNGDMWARLLGDGWRNLVGAQNSDGTAAFLKNTWGQITTSDGKPVYAGDPVAAWGTVAAGLPSSGGNVDYVGQMFPNLDSGLESLGWTL
jgi:hypothetical protein